MSSPRPGASDTPAIGWFFGYTHDHGAARQGRDVRTVVLTGRWLGCGVAFALLLGGVPLRAQTDSYHWNGAPTLHPGVKHAYLGVASPRTMKIKCLQVDVTTPGLRFYSTPRMEGWQVRVQETTTMTTRKFIYNSQSTSKKIMAAVNCQPWKMINGSDWDKSVPVYMIYGMAMSDGVVVSPANAWENISLVIDQSMTPNIMMTKSSLNMSSFHTVGSGFLRVLLQGNASGDTVSLMPRTGIGVSQDSRYVYFMTIDGRQPASEGATEKEVGDWLKHFGSYNGMNADGGGSTTLAWWDPNAVGTDKSQLLNSPRGDGSVGSTTITERHVGQNIGVYYDFPYIYWTGNEDRWGAGSQTPTANDNFSLTQGGTDWQKVSSGEAYHHVYSRASGAMSGTNYSVLMNRASNTLGSLTLVADAEGNGFRLELSDVSTGAGIQLGGPVTVQSGLHVVRRLNDGVNPNTLALATNSVWNVAANAVLQWAIPLTGNFGVTKTEAGTVALSGANTYTGTTVVNGGIVQIDGIQTGAVTVGGSGGAGTPTLGGTGTIGGSVTIKAAGGGTPGTLAPGGTSPGTLTLNNTTLTLESGAKLSCRLGTASDSVTGVSTLTLNGQVWSDFTFTARSGFGPGTYVLIAAASVTGTLGGTVSGSIGSYTGTLSVDGNNDLILKVSGGTPSPVNIDYAVVAGQVILDWPAGQGWQLQAQSNGLSTGLTTNWFPVTDATPPYTNTINPAAPAVFYRLVNP